jgi:hypothetical protein
MCFVLSHISISVDSIILDSRKFVLMDIYTGAQVYLLRYYTETTEKYPMDDIFSSWDIQRHKDVFSNYTTQCRTAG